VADRLALSVALLGSRLRCARLQPGVRRGRRFAVAEEAGQKFVVDDNWERFDWKRRWSSKLLGEHNARRLGTPVTLAQAWLSNSLSASGRENRARISQYKGIHAGGRCVIIGNGPSLQQTDMSMLRNEYTFGLNRLYLMFEELGFETSYHVVVNRYVFEQYATDLKKVEAPLFALREARPFLGDAGNRLYLDNIVGPWFSRDASRGIWQGHTVTYVAMQLAYYMGFSEVVLVGVDHRFATTGKPNQLVEATGPDLSHFDPRYFAGGAKWQLPDLDNSEVAYILARTAFEKDGRRIVDATVDGALKVFPKISLAEALRR
jgi:hypothetical protein